MGTAERPPLAGPTAEVRVLRLARGERPVEQRDRVAGEEPLEIRVGGPGQPFTQVAVTMRTPGADFELAAGFEGVAELHQFSDAGDDAGLFGEWRQRNIKPKQ